MLAAPAVDRVAKSAESTVDELVSAVLDVLILTPRLVLDDARAVDVDENCAIATEDVVDDASADDCVTKSRTIDVVEEVSAVDDVSEISSIVDAEDATAELHVTSGSALGNCDCTVLARPSG